ncbi:uncharacterized protein LOC128869538 [Anastrepha ludens]|uniref:uncharacterized protein LOC128869538 n=1 Tax=Anastrepha ludens TaxID=28586 RepID=UPI0023B081D2|nr:uncharacterized protein LOC128869538 [Anastrepha ludens]
MKYSHGLLVSALSSRSQDYGTPTNAATASSGVLGVGVDSTSPSLGTPVNSEAAAMLQSSAHSGGEVVVPKTFPLSAQEPSCEQLRAMWIFSKRQSRAAEITNEIPTYRDPFVFNVWEPYYSTVRSMGGGMLKHWQLWS